MAVRRSSESGRHQPVRGSHGRTGQHPRAQRASCPCPGAGSFPGCPGLGSQAEAPPRARTFFRALGGRKQFNGYLYAILITAMVFILDGSYVDYALYLGLGLLGTSATVAFEARRNAYTMGGYYGGGYGPTSYTNPEEGADA